MKLAVVTAFPPSKVTLNEYAYHLVKSFAQKEEITELILLTDITDEPKELTFSTAGCWVTVKQCWSFNSYKNLFTVTKAINSTKPDAVLFNLQFMKFGDKKIAAALGLLLPLVCKLKKIPNIVLLHNILEQVDLGKAGFTTNKLMQKMYGFIGTVLTRMILQADVVALTMQKYVDIYKEKYKATNLAFIPHGTFEIPAEPSYEVPDGPLQVMTFGKFGTYKKVEGLIEAVEKIRSRRNLNVEIVIAGTDNPNVPGYLENVKERYAHVPQLKFTGYVEEYEVPVIFNNSAVVVFPYTSTTGSSGVLHQAGSYGKAVVMPDLGDLALLVKHEGYEGEFFEPTSIDSMADAIEKILVNETYRKYLGAVNYKAATAFPMPKIADMYLDTFYKIMNPEKKKDKPKVKESKKVTILQ
ncbi:glycosyltransferase [Neptunitalea lumnitzerae]|uniref:Glycosyl transferase family 1 n=1 Tax=Neptunitalea lumnitzerae TaxID=2965509 RepID=A0ABQ5MF79_9FLAO|nr:glycosyltransferase [Neptunitalea sp. Y10]GLB48058.1 glycosyl transferase family 1 [Neptunitalea sp. Y10]